MDGLGGRCVRPGGGVASLYMVTDAGNAQNRLKDAIRKTHGGEPAWVESVPVQETFEGETAWVGVVEVFELHNHPDADRVYAWSFTTDEGRERFVCVLGVPPVDSPQTAVRAAIHEGQG